MNPFGASAHDQLEEDLELDEFEDPVKPAGAFGNIVSILIPLGLALFALIESLSFGFGTLERPGPGLWPFVVSVVLLGISIGLLIAGKKYWDVESVEGPALNRVFFGMAVLVAYLFIFPSMGFEIASALVTFVWLKVMNKESWLLSIIVSIVMVVVLYVLFIMVFKVPLPRLIRL